MLQELSLPKLNGLTCPSQTWTTSNRSSINYRDSYHSDVDNLPVAGTVTFDQTRHPNENNLMHWLMKQFHADTNLDRSSDLTLTRSGRLSTTSRQRLTPNDHHRDSTSSISSCTLSRLGKLPPPNLGSGKAHDWQQNQSDYHYFPRLNVIRRDSSVDSKVARGSPCLIMVSSTSPSTNTTATTTTTTTHTTNRSKMYKNTTHVNRLICDIKCKMNLIRKMDHEIIEQLNQAGQILTRAKQTKSVEPKTCGRRQLITKQCLMPTSPVEVSRTSRTRTKEHGTFLSSQNLLHQDDSGEGDHDADHEDDRINMNEDQQSPDILRTPSPTLDTKRWSHRFIESPWGQVHISDSINTTNPKTVPNIESQQPYSPRLGNLVRLPKYKLKTFDNRGSDLDISRTGLVTSNFSLHTNSLRPWAQERSLSQCTLTGIGPDKQGMKSTNLKNLSTRLRNPFRRKASTPTPMQISPPILVQRDGLSHYRRSASLSQFQIPGNAKWLCGQNSMPNNLELESQHDDNKLPFIKPKLIPVGANLH